MAYTSEEYNYKGHTRRSSRKKKRKQVDADLVTEVQERRKHIYEIDDQRKASRLAKITSDPKIKEHYRSVTSQLVTTLVSIGTSSEVIARAVGMSLEELQEGYGEELALGEIEVNLQVANVVLEKIHEERDLDAAKFWLKHRSPAFNDKETLGQAMPNFTLTIEQSQESIDQEQSKGAQSDG